MEEIFSDFKSPQVLLLSLEKHELEKRNKADVEKEKLVRDLYYDIAILIAEYWKMKNVLINFDKIQEPTTALNIHISNLNSFIAKMNFEIREAELGRFTPETGKLFPNMTSQIIENANEILVTRTISPAILLNNEIIKGGEILITRPATEEDKIQPAFIINNLTNQKNENQ